MNLSFFGAPDWLDDVAFFVPWAIALTGASALLMREMRRREEHGGAAPEGATRMAPDAEGGEGGVE